MLPLLTAEETRAAEAAHEGPLEALMETAQGAAPKLGVR